ncbi:uncharacterized protein LOC120623290 isoform X1 [Pararge aegeria]|uniref:uncharacterized protein LOC120623290 isoform X1 n=1 Tax=Pararge aegeria TaxID=116150 RepID=UPI0019D16156|nr:uncharacterized protein LOC120623290 isoform X1 [Pararge aegeria]
MTALPRRALNKPSRAKLWQGVSESAKCAKPGVAPNRGDLKDVLGVIGVTESDWRPVVVEPAVDAAVAVAHVTTGVVARELAPSKDADIVTGGTRYDADPYLKLLLRHSGNFRKKVSSAFNIKM